MAGQSILRHYGRFVARTDSLKTELAENLATVPTNSGSFLTILRHGRLFMVVRLLALWNEFCRQLIVLSAMGNSVTLTGTVVQPAPGVQVVQDIAAITKKPLSGPGANWHLPQFSVAAAQALALRNYNPVSLGLGGANVSVLVAVRNHIVHPGQSSSVAFVRATAGMGIGTLTPEDIITAKLPGGTRYFETWVDDLQVAARNACQ